MAHRRAPQPPAELSSIYIAKEGGNVAAADDIIDALTERFYLLSQYAHMGRPATIYAQDCAASRSDNT
jgi:hypothetical protein